MISFIFRRKMSISIRLMAISMARHIRQTILKINLMFDTVKDVNIIWELKSHNKQVYAFCRAIQHFFQQFNKSLNFAIISFLILKVLFSRIKLNSMFQFHSSIKKEPIQLHVFFYVRLCVYLLLQVLKQKLQQSFTETSSKNLLSQTCF